MDAIGALQGLQDARSMRGIMSRGKNVYNAGSQSANRGMKLSRQQKQIDPAAISAYLKSMQTQLVPALPPNTVPGEQPHPLMQFYRSR